MIYLKANEDPKRNEFLHTGWETSFAESEGWFTEACNILAHPKLNHKYGFDDLSPSEAWNNSFYVTRGLVKQTSYNESQDKENDRMQQKAQFSRMNDMLHAHV